MEALITNDLHLGVRRNAGTTLQTQAALRQYLFDSWQALIMQEENLRRNLIINGDTFDHGYVDSGTMLAFYRACAAWIGAGSGKLIVSDGNHDLNKDSSQLCSLHFVMNILKQQFPDRVVHVTEPTEVLERVMIVPHVQNQEKFDLILSDLTQVQKHIILVHANYDNHFAVQADHSLNVSREQAKAITDKGNVLIFGHEHQRKTARGILITGNQFPSSVADCLGNDDKVATILRDGENFGKVDLITTWKAAGSFLDLDWQDIIAPEGIPDNFQFIRVSGEATREQANDVISAIAKLRKTHEAFVIVNAVRVEGVADMGDIQVSLEDARKFNVMEWLMEQLTPEQQAKINDLRAKREAANG